MKNCITINGQKIELTEEQVEQLVIACGMLDFFDSLRPAPMKCWSFCYVYLCMGVI